MARHYKQTRKDRRDESRGMKRYERERGDRSRHDALMLPPDMAEVGNGDNTELYHKGRKYYGPGYGHISNMPPYADLGIYPRGRKYLKTDDYPDTIEEIDTDNDFNYGQLERHRSDSMY